MAKRNRRGHYLKGSTNLDTFWRAVLAGAPEQETLALEQPSAEYYESWYEGQEEEAARFRQRQALMGRQERVGSPVATGRPAIAALQPLRSAALRRGGDEQSQL